MNRLILVCACGIGFSSMAMAADPYERWLTAQSQRGTEIEMIRVASEKPLLAAEATDAEVAGILEEVEAIEKEIGEEEGGKDAS